MKRKAVRALVDDFAERNELVVLHLGLAMTMAKRAKVRLPESVDVEDLAQQGTLGLMKAATRYLAMDWDERGRPPFDAFARRYVWGAIIDSCRRRHFANAKHVQFEEAPVVAVLPAVEQRIDDKRRSRAVRAVVALLPETERKVVEMHYGAGRTQLEIAARLGGGKGRVSRIHRGALVTLRRDLLARQVDKAA